MNQIKSVSALLLLIMAIGATELRAQNDAEPHSKVHVSFFPPLSTNGNLAHLYTNDFSFNILAGVSKNERAFAFAGLGNIILNNAEGFQFAGLANYTGDLGFGFQFSGLANIVRGDMEGFQFGGLLNTANKLEGFQFSGLANVAYDVDGAQFGGLANIAGDVEGFQFGGLFNVAKRVNGAQFAGLVNVAEKSDYPIGLINIIKEGEMGIGVGYNELGTMSVNFRSGGRVLYGILGVGYNHKVKDSKDALSFVGGYGAHINILPWLRINNELTTESMDCFNNEHSNTFKTGYALLPAFRVGSFEIFGGPGLNYIQSKDPEMIRDFFQKNPLWEERHASGRVQQLYIGWQAGAQFIF